MTITNLIFLIFGVLLLLVSIVSFLIYKIINKGYSYDILALIVFGAIIISVSFFSKFSTDYLTSIIKNKSPESFEYFVDERDPKRPYKFVDNYGNTSNELIPLYLEEGTSFDVIYYNGIKLFFKTFAVSEKGSYEIQVHYEKDMSGFRVDNISKKGTIELLDVYNYYYEFYSLCENVSLNDMINVTCYSIKSVDKLNQEFVPSYINLDGKFIKVDNYTFSNFRLVCKIAVNNDIYYLVK